MTQEEAIAAARLTAEWEGWRWYEPVVATRRKPLFSRQRFWDVRTNPHGRHCDLRIVIDDQTGKVTEKRYFPR
jgi:CRISPR/Cas system-associated exonuclease Cas4 (RecB family)